MKRILRYILMNAAVIALVFGCKVDENGILPDDMKDSCFGYFAIDETTSDGYIDLNDPNAFNIDGTVDVLFNVPFDKLTVVVAYNEDYNNPSVLIDNIKKVPLEVSFTMADLIAAIPELVTTADIAIGDQLHVYVIPTVGGIAYPPYQVIDGRVINTVASGVYQELSGVKGVDIPDYVINVPCPYSTTLSTGDFHSKSTDWNSEGDITITLDPDDQYIVYVSGLEEMEGLVEDGGPLKMIISKKDFSVSAPKHVLASDAWGYHNLAYEGTGTFDTCTGKFVMKFKISVDEGSFGTNTFVFTHN